MAVKKASLLSFISQNRIDDLVKEIISDPRNEAGQDFAIEAAGLSRQWEDFKKKKRRGLLRSGEEVTESNIVINYATDFISNWY